MSRGGARLRLGRGGGDRLVLRESRWHALGSLVLALACAAVFYYVLWQPERRAAGTGVWQHVMARFAASAWNAPLVLLPLVLLPQVLRSARVLRRGEVFIFDRATRSIEHNRQRIAGFEEVSAVALRAVNGSCEELTLALALRDGREIEIATSGALAQTAALSERLARLLAVPLRRDAQPSGAAA